MGILTGSLDGLFDLENFDSEGIRVSSPLEQSQLGFETLPRDSVFSADFATHPESDVANALRSADQFIDTFQFQDPNSGVVTQPPTPTTPQDSGPPKDPLAQLKAYNQQAAIEAAASRVQPTQSLAAQTSLDMSAALEQAQKNAKSNQSAVPDLSSFIYKTGGYTEGLANEDLDFSGGKDSRTDNRKIRAARSRLGMQETRREVEGALQALSGGGTTQEDVVREKARLDPRSGSEYKTREEIIQQIQNGGFGATRPGSTNGPGGGGAEGTQFAGPGAPNTDFKQNFGSRPNPLIFGLKAANAWDQKVLKQHDAEIRRVFENSKSGRADDAAFWSNMTNAEKTMKETQLRLQTENPGITQQEMLNHPQVLSKIDAINRRFGPDVATMAAWSLGRPVLEDVLGDNWHDILASQPELLAMVQSGMTPQELVTGGHVKWDKLQEYQEVKVIPVLREIFRGMNAEIRERGSTDEVVRGFLEKPIKTVEDWRELANLNVPGGTRSKGGFRFSQEILDQYLTHADTFYEMSPQHLYELGVNDSDTSFADHKAELARRRNGTVIRLRNPDGTSATAVSGTNRFQSLLDQGFAPVKERKASMIRLTNELIGQDSVAIQLVRTVGHVNAVIRNNPKSSIFPAGTVANVAVQVKNGALSLFEMLGGSPVNYFKDNGAYSVDASDSGSILASAMEKAKAGSFKEGGRTSTFRGMGAAQANEAQKNIDESIERMFPGMEKTASDYGLLNTLFWDLAYSWALTKGQKGRSVSDKDIAIAASIIGKDLSNPSAVMRKLDMISMQVVQAASEQRKMFSESYQGEIEYHDQQYYWDAAGYDPRKNGDPLEGLPPGSTNVFDPGDTVENTHPGLTVESQADDEEMIRSLGTSWEDRRKALIYSQDKSKPAHLRKLALGMFTNSAETQRGKATTVPGLNKVPAASPYDNEAIDRLESLLDKR